MPVGDLGGFQEPVGTRDNKINTIVFFHCCVKNHLDHLQVKKSISNAAERHIRKYKKKKNTSQRDINSPFSLKRTAKLVADSAMACVTV